jgi:signal transduction histidine kinase/ActR/RegA family two-component response regulator
LRNKGRQEDLVGELSSYLLLPLREDATLRRGSGDGRAPVLLATAKDASLASLKRLEHEYALRAELDASWAARPVALSRYNDRWTLVLDDPGGEPLDRLLDGPLETSEFLRIAIPLTSALRHVHERGLIHKDIKPGNILVHRASGGVWLTGFGIASRLPREHRAPVPPEVIAGTLAYMAPEQTGRMNRSVDSRSDLYSLGVSFYEMLTGRLPFNAADAMEWVHCHIARQTVPPDERAKEIPKVLSSIVMKLLAKTAEDRYQTAAGLESDLRRCLAEWETHGRIHEFPLGTHDLSDRLLIPEKLYGRTREIDTLLAAFGRVVSRGTTELVLVSGYSGVGKSSVVNELHKALVPSRGLFASGKFDQYKRNIPYSTVAHAFQSLVRPLLGQSDAELSRTGSFGWRPSSGKIYWSEETFRIFEFDRATTPTVDLVMRQRIHPEDVAAFRQVVERAAHDGQDFAHEYRLRMPDGRVKHLHVVAHAIRTETGDVEFTGAVKDVTEEKWAQAERDRLAQRLRQAEKMEVVGRLAGGVAHDFNNVLAGVFAYGEMVLDEAPGDSPLKRYAQNVLIAATRGRDLVEQILSYSRSQSGTRVPVDVVQVVKETIELIRGSLPAGIRLEASTPESPLIVQSDATQLHRVVMNLCSNAIQAMRAGGILRVLLETEDLSGERALSHGTLGSGRYLRLIVEDSGSGMEEATLARIFEPFFTTKEVGKGTGLGLSLVYAIIADSGGAIDVKSVPQQGSTFTIYLPRSQIMLAAGEAGATALPRGHGERVLLIDDEGPMLAASAELLSQLGYEAVSFSDGRAALAAFDATPERFDAVVTDEIMPGLIGTKLARLVRQRRPGLPVVLVSGHSGASLTQDALAAGLSEWLTKPLQARDTATTLARVLHHSA